MSEPGFPPGWPGEPQQPGNWRREVASEGVQGVGDAAGAISDVASDKSCGCDGCDVPGCDCSPFLIGPLLAGIALAVPGRAPRSRPSVPARGGRLLIRGYQRWLSARLPTRCRHTPTCSSYGLDAVGRYGLWQGSRLTAGRIRRCNRSVPNGTADPVP